MKERPILYAPPMVEAIQLDRKKQTRRVIKPQPVVAPDQIIHQVATNDFWIGTYNGHFQGHSSTRFSCPYGQPGDRLWVRETFYAYGFWKRNGISGSGKQKWKFHDQTKNFGDYKYLDNPPAKIDKDKTYTSGWFKRPSLFMPRAASRILLEITDVAVHRLMDISQSNAIEEGIKPWIGEPGQYENYNPIGYISLSPIRSFFTLWESINGYESLISNPWVWAITFKKI